MSSSNRRDAWKGAGISALIGLALLGYCIFQFSRGRQTYRWVQVNGTVLHSSVGAGRGNGSLTYAAMVEYQYEYQGQTLRGDHIQFGEGGYTSDKGHEQRLADLFTPGKITPVFVNPSMPSESVLLRGTNSSLTTIALFGIFFLLPVPLLLWLRP